MTDAIKAEKVVASTLANAVITSIDDKEATQIITKAKKLIQKKKFLEAAHQYGGLASKLHRDPDIALLAGQTYQRTDDEQSAARWLLQAAERYANDLHSSKALAVLRIYLKLRPDDKENAKRVYEVCKQGGATDKTPSIMLTDEDRAGSKLLASDLFSSFDSNHMDELMKHLKYRKLENKEVLNVMGEKATSLYIIISGVISGFIVLKGKRTYLGDMHEDDICGETAYFTGGRRTAELVAKGQCEIFELPYAMLDHFKNKFSGFNQRIEELYRTRMLVKQLALTPVFEPVTADCREGLAKKMRAVKISAGATLFKQGDSSLDLYLVRSGKLAITINVNGEQRLLKIIETGSIVGEMAIAANHKRTATVRAIADCILMRLQGDDYEDFYKKCPPLQQVLQQQKKKHVRETLDIMKNKQTTEGDDTCEVLLKDIWSTA
jgi:CRP-like cAMP-binding protein